MKSHLIHHMTKVHVKAEMPYQCQICAHRSSQHRDIIEHFQVTHDRTDKLQCPLCLKTYSLYGEKGYNSNNAVSFMQHLQKHEDIKNRNQLNCRKCCLKFIDDKSLKTHLTDDHVSFKDFDNIETYQYVATDTPTKMPRPDEKQLKVAMKKSLAVKPLPQQAAFAAQNLEDMAIYGVIGDRCCECDRSMTMTGHYVAYLCCTKCRYSSCCAKAMSVHVQLFHAGTKPEFDLGKSVIMQEPMYCVCGYSAHSGNKLAKHLGTNGCKSAYPNLEEATKAKVESSSGEESQAVSTVEQNVSSMDQELEKGLDPRISITEAHKNSEKAAQKEGSTGAPAVEASEEAAGPLAFLGLQRKGSREDVDDKKDENHESKNDENNESKHDDVKGSNKEDEVFEKEIENGDQSKNIVESQNKSEDLMNVDDAKKDGEHEDEMNVDDPKQDDGENEDDDSQDQPKETGSVLFGTLFKYMGEKKDEESKADKPASSCEEKFEGSKDEKPELEVKDSGSREDKMEDSGEKKVIDSKNDKIDEEAKENTDVEFKENTDVESKENTKGGNKCEVDKSDENKEEGMDIENDAEDQVKASEDRGSVGESVTREVDGDELQDQKSDLDERMDA